MTMDVVTLFALAVNAAALLTQVASFYMWKGQITETVGRVRRDLDKLEDDLRDGGCPAFGGPRARDS